VTTCVTQLLSGSWTPAKNIPKLKVLYFLLISMVDLIDLSRNLDRSSKKCQLWFLTSFFSNFILQFLDAQCLESILFIRGEKETFCLHSGQIWALDWIGKDHNRWLKGAIMDCENWLLKDGQVGYFGVALKHIYWGSRPERYALGCGTM
jgi:hypothetical protein